MREGFVGGGSPFWGDDTMIWLLRRFVPRTLSILFLYVILVCIPAQATEWTPVGPDSLSVNDYCSVMFWEMPDALFTDEGVYIGFYDQWSRIEDGVNLPAVAGHYVGNDSLLILYGDGSFSDGIYLYTHANGQSQVLEYAYLPNFILRNSNGYYVGHGQGLKRSTDLDTWTDVATFDQLDVLSMACSGDNWAVSVGGDVTGVYTSDDRGQTWSEPAESNMIFNAILPVHDNRWYATYGGDSRSSGLYQSQDDGVTWSVLFYSLGMVDLHYGMEDVAIAWDGSNVELDGIHLYRQSTGDLISMNEGLPCRKINRLSQNDFIDCVNVVACTDSGAYTTCDFPMVDVSQEPAQPGVFSLAVHPNPFNATTTVEVNLPETGLMHLALYDLQGRLVEQLHRGTVTSGNHSFTIQAGHLGTGVYFLVLDAAKERRVQKIVLLK